MAGFNVTVDLGDALETLGKLQAATGDLRPVMDDIGRMLQLRVQRQFELQSEPDGGKWRPLKSGRSGQILRNSGDLYRSITYRATATEVVLGTNWPYAAIHQFGGKTRPHVIRARYKKALAWPGGGHPVRQVNHPGSNIPARPYMLTGSGEFPRSWLAAVTARLQQHLAGAAG